jgi:hypothetical protein
LRVKKARIREYRYLNVGLVIGGSVAALKKQIRRNCSAGEASKASQPPPLAGTLLLFILFFEKLYSPVDA